MRIIHQETESHSGLEICLFVTLQSGITSAHQDTQPFHKDSGNLTQVGRPGRRRVYPLTHLVGWRTVSLMCL